jgi:phosphate transport system permease protein
MREPSSAGRPEEGPAVAPADISQPPSAFDRGFDRVFRGAPMAVAWVTILLVVYVVWHIGWVATPAIRHYGGAFLVGMTWDSNRAEFGVLPAIVGTLYSSVLGLAFGTVFGLAIAIFLSEGFLASGLDTVIRAAGLAERRGWARLPDLNSHLGWLPWFSTPLSGPGLLPAALVLAIMVLPTISAISRDALIEVPPKIREAAFGLGATRWEAILAVIVPTASTGIFGAVILGFGRALGETMALAMLAGNANVVSWSIFSPANTLAALLANHFPEAGKVEVGALMYAALVLLAITLAVNVVGTIILDRANASLKGLR